MSKIVLKAENISKQYRLGQLGTGTISHDLNRVWARFRGKEDPYLKVGEANDRSVLGGSDYVWSLKDINFEVKQGEVLGIIGKNGAGKSTLLKILSQVTTPTTGQVKIKGCIAALLEVGTGFHPDLSGRENIYLNGAILGMTKTEIKSKLDEIVDFSGVAKYLDTPVKRYSSGMMVRLGFAVAAHLDPEILIVDEVLAVGDQEFQNKCLGKMNAVANEGRTVLFVSHNMSAVKTLCTRAVILSKGKMLNDGPTSTIINEYLSENYEAKAIVSWAEGEEPGNQNFKIKRIELISDGSPSSEVDISKELTLRVIYSNNTQDKKYQFSIHLMDSNENMILASLNAPSATIKEDPYFNKPYEKGIFQTQATLPANFLNENRYHLNLVVSHDAFTTNEVFLDKVITFNGHDLGEMKKSYSRDWGGLVRIKLNWQTQKI
jgi:lipopolysaccharide transport system ATP-binding protein